LLQFSFSWLQWVPIMWSGFFLFLLLSCFRILEGK
jgi:hypothetical protein